MNAIEWPWLAVSLGLPWVGVAALGWSQSAVRTQSRCLTTLLALLAATLGASWAGEAGPSVGAGWFRADSLAAPLLPVLAVLHLLTFLGTAKSRVTRTACMRQLMGAGLSLAALTCQSTGGLVVLAVLGVAVPGWELWERRGRWRSFALHQGLFIGLLVVGWFGSRNGAAGYGHALLLLAVLVRGGIVPAQAWVPSLFERASYAGGMAFVLPLTELMVAIRLLVPVASGTLMELGAWACLLTAVYGGGMAVVQQDLRRFYAHLCVSQTSLVLYGALLQSANGLTASLCLWLSASLSLAGLAFAVRALEARFGPLSLREYHGCYETVPGLAVCFLVAGLACVGFPGTIGFVPLELLISGSVEEGIWTSVALALATMLNGVAILRAYFSLFTGRRRASVGSLPVTAWERVGIAAITVLVFAGAWVPPSVAASRHRVAETILTR